MRRSYLLTILVAVFLVGVVGLAGGVPAADAAYNHDGDTDSANFRSAYTSQVGTKLDSCALCHSGGSYESGGKTTTLGNCQWCHYKYGYDASGDILATLNPYGLDYLSAGRDGAAIADIVGEDSDGDDYSNADEIAATRYPGDPADDPTKVPAPYRVFSRDELEDMPQHAQFMLMNASKSDDFYALYTGVTLERLLSDLRLESATGVTVYSPDGFSQVHPFDADPNPSVYQITGVYPTAVFFYNTEADISLHPDPKDEHYGWCDYTAPSVTGRQNGALIENPEGLRMLLAIKRDGSYLDPGVLNLQNKLDGEGPFRMVPPQKSPGPPDQRSTSKSQSVVWPYDSTLDHNSGFSTRTVTIIKVGPLPEGTTDINLLEAGWPYVDGNQVVVYGAIDPIPTVLQKVDALSGAILAADPGAFKGEARASVLDAKLSVVRKQVEKGNYAGSLKLLEQDLSGKLDGCVKGTEPDGNDWAVSCDVQKHLYWSANEVAVLLRIAAP